MEPFFFTRGRKFTEMVVVTFEAGPLGLVLGCREDDSAAIVVSVKAGGAAAVGGVREGDVITSIAGQHMADYDAVIDAMGSSPRPVVVDFEREKPPPPPPPKKSPPLEASSKTGWLDATEKAEKKGSIGARWEALREQHQQRQEERLQRVRQATTDDVAKRTADLDMDNVAKKVQFFSTLFARALETAMTESRVMSEKDRDKASRERERRRKMMADQVRADRQAHRASRPSIENVAAHPDELRIALQAPTRGSKLVYALVDVDRLDRESKDAREDAPYTWHAYDGPLTMDEPGSYAVLSKVVPVDKRAAIDFEAAAQELEAGGQAPRGYADLAAVLIDAVRLGVTSKAQAYGVLDECRRGDCDVKREIQKWNEKVAKADVDEAALKARKQRKAARAANQRTAAMSFDVDYASSSDKRKSIPVVATSGRGLLRVRESPEQTAQRVVQTSFDDFVDACAADETTPDFDEPPPDESEIASAVYELSASPPIMWHEDHDAELSFVPFEDPTRRCRKCGRTDKLYAEGDFVICRACALEGAGVLVDPGARRMWFSQMIEFYPSREIPLPKSHPLLAQILKVLANHPGIAVRFEGHVNSACGLDCDGSKPCKSTMCNKVPGGAMGLSKARAESVKQFILACGIEADRVHAVGFAGTRRLTDILDEKNGKVNRRVEVHTLLC